MLEAFNTIGLAVVVREFLHIPSTPLLANVILFSHGLPVNRSLTTTTTIIWGRTSPLLLVHQLSIIPNRMSWL